MNEVHNSIPLVFLFCKAHRDMQFCFMCYALYKNVSLIIIIILDWTLDSGPKGCGFDSRQCLQPDILSALLLSNPGVLMLYPVGWDRYLSFDVACVHPSSGAWPECSPGSWEGVLWMQDWYWIQCPGVIIQNALWVLSHTRKTPYKNKLLLLFQNRILKCSVGHSNIIWDIFFPLFYIFMNLLGYYLDICMTVSSPLHFSNHVERCWIWLFTFVKMKFDRM